MRLFPLCISHFIFLKNNIPYPPGNMFFNLFYQLCEKYCIDISYKYQIYNFIINTPGKCSGNIYFSDFSQSFYDCVNNFVKSNVFQQKVVGVLIKRMVSICSEIFSIALGISCQHSCFFETIEFYSDGIGRISKFTLQTPQIRC